MLEGVKLPVVLATLTQADKGLSQSPFWSMGLRRLLRAGPRGCKPQTVACCGCSRRLARLRLGSAALLGNGPLLVANASTDSSSRSFIVLESVHIWCQCSNDNATRHLAGCHTPPRLLLLGSFRQRMQGGHVGIPVNCKVA